MKVREFGPNYDNILAKLCEMVVRGQKTDPDECGMVAACVVDPEGNQVYGINHRGDGGKRIHAERTALDNYIEMYGHVDPECTVVTTLSPCCNPMQERQGESCEDLLDEFGITKVYCGYQDPTQESNHDYTVTKNPKIQELCQAFADTFLEPDQLDELSFLGSPCTKDCSGHRAGYEWSRQKGGRVPNSWSQSFNNGAQLQRDGK